MPGVIFPRDHLVHIRIGYGETELRERVKQAGGFWNAEKRAWRLSFNRVLAHGLDRRTLDEEIDL